MLKFYKRTKKDSKLNEINKLEVGTWINVENPDENEINYLIDELKLDKPNILAGLDEHEIPRVDIEDNETYIFIKTLSPDKIRLSTLLIILGESYILTLSKNRPLFVDELIEKTTFLTTQKLKSLITIFSLNSKLSESATLNAVKIVQQKKNLDELEEKDVSSLLEKEIFLNNLVSSFYHEEIVYHKLVKNVKLRSDYHQSIDMVA